MTAVIDTDRRSAYRSPYDHRLDLVTSILRERTDLDADAARGIAVSVLHAMDTVPEHIR